MEFTVPQFIEREPKVIGPLTFKQFVFLAIPGGISFCLYFIIGKKNFPLFVVAAAILMLGGVAFGFVKIRGYPISIFLKNIFTFSLAPKIFVWRRKTLPPKIKKVEKIEEKKVVEPLLKIAEKSHLQKLSTQVETKRK